MTSFEFFELLSLNPLLYLFCLVLSFILFYRILKVTSSSWFNPIRFNIFTFSIGFSVVIFLFISGYIRLNTFIYTVISIVIFWFTFMSVYKNKQRKITIRFSGEPLFAKYLFFFSYSIYIFLTIMSYKLLGIPIFNEDSRLATYTGSGFGFIARISPVLYIYSLFYIIHLLCRYKGFRKRLLNVTLLIPLILFGVLSGSRSSFLGIIFTFWGYKTFFLQEEPKVKNFKWLIVPFLFLSLLTFSIQYSGDFGRAGLMFLDRVVACGDLYWEALPNDTWKSVVVNRPYEFTFMGFLGPLHLLDRTLAETPIGFQLTDIIYPSIAGRSTGPVALFPIFGLVCYGYIGGLVFSFFQAFLASFLFKKAFINSNSIIVSAMAFYAFSNIILLIGDISAGLGACLEILICYAFMASLLLVIALLLYLKNTFLIKTN